MEENVHKALNKFIKDGGLVKQLPDQVTPRSRLVGTRWGVYELNSKIIEAQTIPDKWIRNSDL